jgi:hypothetical protein
MSYKVSYPQRVDISTPATTWVIDHSVGGYPIVDCYVDISGTVTKIMPESVTYNTPVQVTIVFSTAQAGFAVLA